MAQSNEKRASALSTCSSIAEYRDKFHPISDEIYKACLRLDKHLSKSGCTPKTHYIIKTIFYEFVHNIRLHSMMNPLDKISVRILINESTIAITFIDSGIEFDVSKQPHGPIVSAVYEEERISYGINLINILSDSVEYERSENSENITKISIRRRNK